jgi:hypothetical protein
LGILAVVAIVLVCGGHKPGAADAAVRASTAVPSVRADFDGDNRLDRAFLTHIGGVGSPAPFFLHVRLANGETFVRSLAQEPVVGEGSRPCVSFCYIEGAGDLSGSGRSEIAIGIHTGTHGGIFVLFAIAHGRLVQLTAVSGDRPRINHGLKRKTDVAVFGSYSAGLVGEAVVCRGSVVVDAAWGEDPQQRNWLVTEDTWRLRGTRLVLLGERHLRRLYSPSASPVPGRPCLTR